MDLVINKNKAYTICVCDDDKIDLDLICNNLELKGYEVIKFSSPISLLTYYKQNYALIDLLIFDYLMDINGYDLYKECLKIYKTPLIVISSQIELIDINKFISLGCNNIIKKPLNFSYLHEVIQELVKKRSDYDKMLGLKLLNGFNELYNKIEKSFYNTYKDYKERFDKLIYNNDLEALRNEIHKIKGISLNISQIKLYHITKVLNYYLKENVTYKDISALYLEFEDILNNVLKYIEQESVKNNV